MGADDVGFVSIDNPSGEAASRNVLDVRVVSLLAKEKHRTPWVALAESASVVHSSACWPSEPASEEPLKVEFHLGNRYRSRGSLDSAPPYTYLNLEPHGRHP
jgi:hypothetical protein